MNPDQLLQTLHDIQLPPEPHWWPPAPGWWLVAILLLGLCGLTWVYMRRAWQRRCLRKTLLSQLRALFQQHAAPQAECSKLLKRMALARFPAQQVAALHGEAWLHFLDRSSASTQFSQGIGRCLLTAPYQPLTALPDDTHRALKRLCERWIKQNY